MQGNTGNYISLYGKPYSCFAGNDYLGFASHPDVIQAAALALEKYGVNFSASRKTTGTSDIHLELERLLAEFKGQEAAVVFASGYMGNKLLFENLKGRYDAIFVDSMAHPSILDGIPRDLSNFSFYHHCDPDHLEKLLKKSKSNCPLIVTDGIFALTGEIAPLDQIYPLATIYNAILLVDDAHATGVLGKSGKGTPEHFNLGHAPGLYQSETMSKALGAYGGFIAADGALVQKIRSESAFYGASTALPPPLVAAGCTSVKLIGQQAELRETLMQNAELIRNGIKNLEFSTTGEGTPIVPLLFNNWQDAKSLSGYLKENGMIAPALDYPVKTGKFIVRITASSNHCSEQIENLLDTLKKWRNKHGRDNH
ncbi:MAG: pyridoxal phosphate-dependent aminotransferase family protein [Prolixibacteraceae bacterium]|jgi:7-keto-8-aminopelargonate synthetase-like enzyme|nr:pyridoxal phosphate-dependent aminotransferase family protein [Prolixibacteraceae bacterium]